MDNDKINFKPRTITQKQNAEANISVTHGYLFVDIPENRLKVEFSFSHSDSSQGPNECDIAVQSHNKRVVVSWTVNVGLMTPDHYNEICFGKVSKGMPLPLLCWSKATNAFAFSRLTESLSTWRNISLSNPQAKKHRDDSVTVSVEMSTADNFGQLVYWEIIWSGMHNRVIDEMLYCTYRVGM